MIEEARKSLESYLKSNINFIIKDTNNLNVLRNTWNQLNPEFSKHDINLDVVWEGLSGGFSGCCACECNLSIFWTPDKAKSFRVEIRDWSKEKYLNNKMKKYA